MLQLGRTVGSYSVIRAVATKLRCKPHLLKFPSNYMLNAAAVPMQVRYFSNEDFKKTLNDIKNKSNGNESQTEEGATSTNEAPKTESSGPNFDSSGVMRRVGDLYYSFIDNIKLAYSEMIDDKESSLNRKIDQASTYRAPKVEEEELDEDGEPKKKEEVPVGPSAIVLVKEGKTPWEQMKERLNDSPIIQEILKNSKHYRKVVGETDLGKKAEHIGQSVSDKIHDAREFWETSQNPLIYTLSGVWDNVTGQTEEGICISEIRKLDPKFNIEDWAEDVKKNLTLPVIKAHLKGETSFLKKWLGEAVYNKLSADIRTRKHDGIVFDPNVLDLDEVSRVLSVVESGKPVVVLTYMVQQINCIKNREGEVIMGGESQICAKFYVLAFQQEYSDDDSSVTWKVVDYQFGGDTPYY